jgi:hypothetical protein
MVRRYKWVSEINLRQRNAIGEMDIVGIIFKDTNNDIVIKIYIFFMPLRPYCNQTVGII